MPLRQQNSERQLSGYSVLHAHGLSKGQNASWALPVHLKPNHERDVRHELADLVAVPLIGRKARRKCDPRVANERDLGVMGRGVPT